jgi:hypothetical protein
MSPLHPGIDDGMDPERGIRAECAESQAWANHARRVAEDRHRHRRFLALIWTAIILAAIIAIASTAASRADARVRWNTSTASVYDGVGLGGRVACLGRWPGGYVLAHKTLPCGTRVRLRYRGRYVTARVWDRGPFVAGREFDLDVAVQRALGFPFGVAPVQWRIPR